jgi:hypothetical protein
MALQDMAIDAIVVADEDSSLPFVGFESPRERALLSA